MNRKAKPTKIVKVIFGSANNVLGENEEEYREQVKYKKRQKTFQQIKQFAGFRYSVSCDECRFFDGFCEKWQVVVYRTMLCNAFTLSDEAKVKHQDDIGDFLADVNADDDPDIDLQDFNEWLAKVADPTEILGWKREQNRAKSKKTR